MKKPGQKSINGDDNSNTLDGTKNADFIYGFGGDDKITGWDGNDQAFGGQGNDLVNGGRGNDTLYGDAGNDTLVGEAGNDSLFGGDGNDLLIATDGNDRMDGGAESDKFMISAGRGVYTIQNFAAEDKIDLGAFHFASSQAAIDAFKQFGQNAVLDLGPGNHLVLEHTKVSDFSVDQFDVSTYLVPTASNISFKSVMTVGDHVGDYAMPGIPDGLGAFDNGDGTFTVLMNHELTSTEGAVRDHGFIGAFVSKLVIDKTTLQVLDGSDLIQHAFEYDPATHGYVALNDALNRFCSADLAVETAFYNPTSGLGYNGGRLFLNGEEGGTEGRAFAHIASGVDEGNSYELAWLGNLAYENVVANGYTGDKTVVAVTDDGQNGQVYFYFGDKQATGSAIDRAGLTDGSLYGLKVTELADLANNETDAVNLGGDYQSTFSLVNLGNVSALNGAALDLASETAGVTSFLRPEDGAWDTINHNRFYFVTTNALNHPSRLWAADFVDASDPSKGGTISMLLDGTEGQQMFDNITVNKDGQLILLEDVGNVDNVGRVWHYNPTTDTLTQAAQLNSARFAPGADFFLTRDEESSGVIDVTDILGSATQNAYLVDVQAHFTLGGSLVQGGQLLAMYEMLV